jgi:RNA polymerase sigma factor (sigma-70 family)
VNELTDQQLLRDYSERHSEPAFAELVRRHVDLVYTAALRMVCDSHLAEDVTQGAFVALARNSPRLTDRPVLSGWLHCTAQNLAANAVRSEVRRRAREQEAVAMNELLSPEFDASWEAIAPQLDAALGELNEADRDALLLRYFEKKSAQEMAGILGISDEAAQKRVSRAVERLREYFSKRKVSIGVSGLAALISANAVQSAPAGLATAISAAALLTGTVITASTATAITVTKTIAMTAFQKALVTVTVVALAGAGIYETQRAAQLGQQNQILQQQQAPLADQIQQLQQERDRDTNRLADLLAENARLKTNPNQAELLKLRGQAGQAHTAVQELAKMKVAAGQPAALPALFTNAMARGMATAENFRKKEALAKVARMREKLHLTDEQAQGIADLMVNHIEQSSQQMLKAMSVGQMPGQTAIPSAGNEETEIKALLTSDQLAAYPDFTHAEAVVAAENLAKYEVADLAGEMELTQEQQDKIHSALFQYTLSQTSSTPKPDAMTQARAGGNLADVISLQVDSQKQALEAKLQLLDGILSAEQLQTYKQKQLDMMDMQTSALKMFLPQTTNAVAP